MPRDGTIPEEDRALIRARQILGRQNSFDQGGWSTCLYGGLRKEGIVGPQHHAETRTSQVSRSLGVSIGDAGHLVGLASVRSKCAVLDAVLAERGLRVPPSPSGRGVRWVRHVGAAAGLLAFSVASAALLVTFVPHFW